jgi:TP901 family phage tail tape measure protein
MADSTNTKIIYYVADIAGAITGIKNIEQQNAKLAKTIGQQFGDVGTIISSTFKKISTTSKVNPSTGLTEQIKLYNAQETIIKGLTGSYIKYTEAQSANSKNGVKDIQTLEDVTAKYLKLEKAQNKVKESINPLIGKASQLGTNFQNTSDINNKFADRLKSFGLITGNVKKNLDYTAGGIRTFGYEATTTSGKTVAFTESIKRTSDGIQRVSRTLKEANKPTETLAQSILRLSSRAIVTIPVWMALRGAVMGTISVFKNGVKDLVAFDLALQKVARNMAGTPKEIANNMAVMRNEITKASIEFGVSTEDISEAVKKFATLGFSFEESMAGGIASTKLATVLFGSASETANSFARALNLLIDRSDGAKSATEQMNEAMALTAELEKTNQFEINEVNQSLINFGGTAKTLGLNMRETLALLATMGSNLISGAKGGTLLSTSFQQLIGNLDKIPKTLGISVNPKLESMTQIFMRVMDEIERLGKVDIEAQSKAISTLFGGVRGAKAVRALVSDLELLRTNLSIVPDTKGFEQQVTNVVDTLSGQSKRLKNLSKEFGKELISTIINPTQLENSIRGINVGLEFIINNMEKAKKAVEAYKKVRINPVGFILDITAKPKIDPKIINKVNKEIEAFKKTLGKDISDGMKTNPVPIDATLDVQSITIEETRNKLAEIVLDSELDRLKSIGASNVELLKAEDLYRNLLNISLQEEDALRKKLELEQAIGEEKQLQSKLGSDSIKLFRIAQTEGSNIAKQIGDVLSGDRNFDAFVATGGKALETFKKEFGDIFEQQQAIQFFKGKSVPGARSLTGGKSIDIQEQAIREPISTANISAIASREGVLPTRTAQAVNAVSQTNNITNNFNIDTKNPFAKPEDLIVDSIIKAMESSKVKQKLSNLIAGDNQTNVL